MDRQLRVMIDLFKSNKGKEFTAAELMKLFRVQSRFHLELMIQQAKQEDLYSLKTTSKGWVL